MIQIAEIHTHLRFIWHIFAIFSLLYCWFRFLTFVVHLWPRNRCLSIQHEQLLYEILMRLCENGKTLLIADKLSGIDNERFNRFTQPTFQFQLVFRQIGGQFQAQSCLKNQQSMFWWIKITFFEFDKNLTFGEKVICSVKI